MFRAPRYSNWRIAGSAGVEVQIETPVVNLSAGAAYLQLPLVNTRTRESITVHMAGVGIGVGVGVSALGIVDIEGSLSSFPSDGIGQLVAGPRAGRRIRRQDFVGNRVLSFSVGAKAVGGGSLVGLAFIQSGWVNRIGSAAIPGPIDDITLWSHAAGLFYGASVGTGASAGVSTHEYRVLSVH